MLPEEYRRLDATAVAALVTRRETSAVEVARAALARLAEADPRLRAFRTVTAEQALADAREVDRAVAGGRCPPLAGVPIGVKAWEGVDAPQTRRLRAAGCVVIGLTSVPRPTTEWQTWGHTDRGPTVNPWRADRSPGGSSAGSAAAVAAGVVPLATASDGAGSTRIPAAWCGVIGLKATGGRLPARDAAGLNVPGAVVRTARDAALHLSVLLGEDVGPGGPDRPVAVWSSTLGFAEVGPEQAGVARAAAGALRLTWRERPVRLCDPAPAWRALRGLPADPSAAEAARRTNDERLRELFAEADLLLTPTTPTPPHGHDGPGTAMTVGLTWGFNISGHPAISVPAGLAADGTPVGLQAVARPGREDLLLRLAADLERLRPWPSPPG
ncbi:amidase family protein [Thermomonospora cellulosilytica]|uniref:Asp-tRNA(Asn)/Glu-tRNA(Gln) amidotransferase A subunit family amidase n=1 Tax=Thermomonospora cellulosilytica TaxID=1411118 RepID=A0A7W3MYX0_9ACTN|nr:amidase [Thermomonospora cellulosilytica]MBA9004444.1 Asp-tRNA(Asn)/Glu-tRNA(Gln) amidotransferase A subunit family amidase [Thermomonospora cellulosilytica]